MQEIEESVITKIRDRRETGRRKYGTTMEREDLTLEQWAIHAQEEALDLAIYLEKIIRANQKNPVCAACGLYMDRGIPTTPFEYDGDMWKLTKEGKSFDLWKWSTFEWSWHDNITRETAERMTNALPDPNGSRYGENSRSPDTGEKKL